MLLSRKRRKFDKTGERIAGEIYSEFEIKIATTTNVSPLPPSLTCRKPLESSIGTMAFR